MNLDDDVSWTRVRLPSSPPSLGIEMRIELVPWLQEMIDYFWEQRAQIVNEDFVFDYPDYGGLPKRISNKLYSDLVDVLQYEVKPCLANSKTKRQFAGELIDVLGRGLIKVK